MRQLFPKPTKAERVEEKRDLRRERSKARQTIRHQAIARAHGRCENPTCKADLREHGAIMDHWLGGSGRREQEESLDTVWMLCLRCNQERTDNRPSARYWNHRFNIHCNQYGYNYTPHILNE